MALGLVLGACSGGKPPAGAAADEGAAGGPSEASTSSAVGREGGRLVLDGERFSVRTVYDDQLRHMPVYLFVAPEKWRDRSGVNWNFGNTSNPVATWSTVENPAGVEAFYLYPGLALFWLDRNYSLRPGQSYLGLIFAQVEPPEMLLTRFARQLRGKEAGFEVVGGKMLPGLAAALPLPKDSTPRQGVGVKVRYTSNGQPVEEEFYGLYYRVNVPYDGPQGRSWQTDWGLQMLHSFRAPAGTLDRRRDVFTAMTKSIRRNPAWLAQVGAINRYLQVQFQRELQAGYDQIAAAGRLSRQLAANSDAMLASIDSQRQSSRGSGGGATSGGVDKFDDYVRGVETTDDPYYGTSQHSVMESYHWTDGYGNYRNTNDPGANPNQTENGSWTLMQSSR